MATYEDVMELGDEDILDVRTDVSEVMFDLARLADGSGKPKLRGAVEWNELERAEAWVITLVTSGFTVDAIHRMSPLDEETTTQLLAKLVESRTITMA